MGSGIASSRVLCELEECPSIGATSEVISISCESDCVTGCDNCFECALTRLCASFSLCICFDTLNLLNASDVLFLAVLGMMMVVLGESMLLMLFWQRFSSGHVLI